MTTRILITGVKGQLGTELTALLAGRADVEVIGVDLPEWDLTDRDLVVGSITTNEPDVILHGGAMTAVDLCETEPETAWRANAMGTRFVADGARRVGAHVVYVSTDYVFDGEAGRPYVEWDRPNPQSVYGRSKLGGEMEIDPAWSIARTSWVCSAHGNNMVKTALKLGAAGQQVRFVDDQFGCPTFAGDLAAMVLQLGIGRIPGIFHCTNTGAVNWYQFVRAIYEAGGFDPDLVSAISTEQLDPPRPAPRPKFSVLDNIAWRTQGFAAPRPFAEPLAEVVTQLRADGFFDDAGGR